MTETVIGAILLQEDTNRSTEVQRTLAQSARGK